MDKGMIKNFLNEHPIRDISVAGLEYYFFIAPEAVAKAREKARNEIELKEEDIQMKTMIRDAETAEELLNLCRKNMNRLNTDDLRAKLLEKQEMMMPIMKEKALTMGSDIAVENFLHFFLRCEENPSDWIFENLTEIRSAYMRSMLGMVLGIRGKKEMLEILMKEVEWMEKYSEDKNNNQGPLIGVRELGIRFYRLEV